MGDPRGEVGLVPSWEGVRRGSRFFGRMGRKRFRESCIDSGKIFYKL